MYTYIYIYMYIHNPPARFRVRRTALILLNRDTRFSSLTRQPESLKH